MNKELAVTSCEIVDALNIGTSRDKCAFERYALRTSGELLALIAHSPSADESDRLWKQLYKVVGDVVEENSI